MKMATQSLGISSQRNAADGDGSQKEGGIPRYEDKAVERRFLCGLVDHAPTLTSLLSAAGNLAAC